MKVGATWVARVLLKRLHDVDPEVLAEIKIILQMFNARRKVWTEKPVDASETQS